GGAEVRLERDRVERHEAVDGPAYLAGGAQEPEVGARIAHDREVLQRRAQDGAHDRHRLPARAPAADADRHSVLELGDDFVLAHPLVGHRPDSDLQSDSRASVVGDAVRFHQAVAFLDTSQLLDLARASDATGSPIWPPDTDWPDPWCLISAMAGTTATLQFTTGVYIAPARDLVTVAKLVGTAAVLSGGRVRLGVGAGWCKEEFDATGQRF